MISSDNYSEHHIRELQVASKRDPGLIERTLYAFGLLEALRKVEMDFIFKGGTSLLLLLPHPKRLSTDIDIVVEPDTNVDEFISKAGIIFPFVSKEEQMRQATDNIVKRHFKFTYESPMMKAPLYILLDVLFEKNHYESVIEKEIQNELFLTLGENLKVRVPSVDCILGDKLTAFAPYTTGIPLGKNKDLDVVKQFYDIATLIDEFESFEDVRKTFFSVSEAELGYRKIGLTPKDALEDTIRAAICIGSRGKLSSGDFPSYFQGTRSIGNHVFDSRFSMEVASRQAPKVIYMATCLLTGKPFEKNVDLDSLKTENLTQEDLKTMKAFRKFKSDEYGYLVLADRLLSKYKEE